MMQLGTKLFSRPERVQQRKVASFLRRVVVAMEDGTDLLDDPDEAAEGAAYVLGEDAPELGLRLFESARRVAEVGRRLAEGLDQLGGRGSASIFGLGPA